MAKRIYWILGILAFLVILYFIISPGSLPVTTVVWFTTAAYIVFVGCFHGVVAHSLTVKQKGNLIIYPVLMGILFGIFAFVYIFLLLPRIVPGFIET